MDRLAEFRSIITKAGGSSVLFDADVDDEAVKDLLSHCPLNDIPVLFSVLFFILFIDCPFVSFLSSSGPSWEKPKRQPSSFTEAAQSLVRQMNTTCVDRSSFGVTSDYCVW